MFTEDLSLFFNPAQLGVTVTIDGTSVNGVFGKGYVESNFVQTEAPIFTFRKADKSSVAVNSTIVNGADTYKVKVLQPDVTGTVLRLVLERQ
jgi:hypothetical protein